MNDDIINLIMMKKTFPKNNQTEGGICSQNVCMIIDSSILLEHGAHIKFLVISWQLPLV